MKTSLLLLLAAVAMPAWAEDSTLPGDGFQPQRYEQLWTKSPFSVATPDAIDASPDYVLVGVTQLEGVSYISVVDAHTQDHFIVSSDKDSKGLKVSSINRSTDGKDTFATVLKDGQPLTLKLQAQPAAAPIMPTAEGNAPVGVPPPAAPGVVQNIPMPGANNPPPVQISPGVTRPFSRLHRTPIHLPPAPQATPTPANGQPAPANGQPPPANGQPNPGGAPIQPHTVPPQ